nr:hypothetical protein [Tanacetum cinerariifolium]
MRSRTDSSIALTTFADADHASCKDTGRSTSERFAFNVSLRMFTRSIIIQRCVEDLQLGVKSYQKKLNLTKPDTYRSDLKRKEAYIAYSNPRGFIYQNKDRQNMLMRIDELHKFNDGTLIDVRTTLDDRLKGIQMKYLPQTIWRKSDKERAAAMIQAIDKMLKTRRIMRSLERSDEQKNLYKALVDAYKCDKLILDTYGDTITLKRRRDDADKDEKPSAGSNRGESAPAKEPMHNTQDLEEPAHQEFEIGATNDQHVEEASQHPHCNLAKKANSRTSFNELMDTPVDFLAFVMNRLKVDTLNSELLAGPTYKLMKGSCKSLVELELFLKEVYKATTDQLDWNNPEGKQYPHDLLKLLPLILNSWGRRVIPFDHFIKNDFEYLRGGVSS